MNTSIEINGDALKARGWPASKAMGLALKRARALREQNIEPADILQEMDAVLANPSAYIGNALWRDTAHALMSELLAKPAAIESTLRDASLPYPVWGRENIDPAALSQMVLPLI